MRSHLSHKRVSPQTWECIPLAMTTRWALKSSAHFSGICYRGSIYLNLFIKPHTMIASRRNRRECRPLQKKKKNAVSGLQPGLTGYEGHKVRIGTVATAAVSSSGILLLFLLKGDLADIGIHVIPEAVPQHVGKAAGNGSLQGVGPVRDDE